MKIQKDMRVSRNGAAGTVLHVLPDGRVVVGWDDALMGEVVKAEDLDPL